jgi:hypothetical protein
LAWQSYGGTAKQIIASSAPQLSSLLSTPALDPSSDRETDVAQPGSAAGQASAPQTASVPQTASAPLAASGPTASETAAATAPSPELQQQLATMAHDLAAVQQSVEQLAAGQEQMARDIAKLQTAEQDIRRRISAPSPAAAAAARKPVPPPPPAPQSSAALLPPAPPPPAPQPSVAPLPPAPPEPPRPPMPVR